MKTISDILWSSIHLFIKAGSLRYSCDNRRQVETYLPVIKERKAELIEALTPRDSWPAYDLRVVSSWTHKDVTSTIYRDELGTVRHIVCKGVSEWRRL